MSTSRTRALGLGLLLALGLAACEEETDCRKLSANDCEAAGCRVLTGRGFSEDGGVQDRAAGCLESEAVCGAAQTCAEDPETGEVLLFPATCIPHRWNHSTKCDAIADGGE